MQKTLNQKVYNILLVHKQKHNFQSPQHYCVYYIQKYVLDFVLITPQVLNCSTLIICEPNVRKISLNKLNVSQVDLGKIHNVNVLQLYKAICK